MFRKQTWSVLFIGMLSVSNYLFAQEDTVSCTVSCHCMSNLTPAGVMISHVHPKGEWMFSYRYMNMGMKGLLSGSSSTSSDVVFNSYLMNSDAMKMDMHMLMGMYGITDRLTGMLMLNYNVNSMDMSMLAVHNHAMSGMEMSPSTAMKMNSAGLGDLKLSILYGLVKNMNHQLLIAGGVSIPTGSIQVQGLKDDMLYSSNRLPYMMQLGSGTVDVTPTVSYIFQQKDFAFSSQVSSTVRTSTNSVGYQLGNEYTIGLWGAYNWWDNFSSSLRFEGQSIDKISGFDQTIYAFNEISANPFNYGGKKLNVYFGTAYQFDKSFLNKFRLSAEYGLPIYQNVNGIQNKLTHSLFASLSYSF